MGWLDGALRIMPAWEIRVAGFEIPNPFFPGVLLAGLTFSLLFLWPFLEARVTGDHAEHHLLDRPRQRPVRTALGAATIAFYVVLLPRRGRRRAGVDVRPVGQRRALDVPVPRPAAAAGRGLDGLPAVQGAVGARRRAHGVPCHRAADPRRLRHGKDTGADGDTEAEREPEAAAGS